MIFGCEAMTIASVGVENRVKTQVCYVEHWFGLMLPFLCATDGIKTLTSQRSILILMQLK
jgi:hypothetical protein